MAKDITNETLWEKIKSSWLYIIIIIWFCDIFFYSMYTQNIYNYEVIETQQESRTIEKVGENSQQNIKRMNSTMEESSEFVKGVFKEELNNKAQEYNYSREEAQTTNILPTTPPYFNLLNHDYYRPVEGKNVINTEEMKYILYWNTFHGNTSMNLGLGKDIFNMCPVKTCMTTHNHTFMPEEKYHAIIFHGARWKSKQDGYPAKRNPNQKYIFFTWESPYNTHFDIMFYNNHKHFYNWTLTYRRDSDIHFPYGIIQKVENDYKTPSRRDYNKTKVAAWLVSNCWSPGTIRRKKYVEELQKYIQVDVYGKCSQVYCKNCHQLIQNEYYFYIAFENSMCSDYVTEKLYRTLSFDVVPIVLGFSDYKSIAPPYSFIDTNDFPTPKLLVAYLKKLTQNWDLYTEYFEWKKHYQSRAPREYALCQMCEMLHRPIEYTTYEDIKQWYFGFHCYVR